MRWQGFTADTLQSKPSPQVANESQEDETEVEHVARSCHDCPANKIDPRMDLHILDESWVYRRVRRPIKPQNVHSSLQRPHRLETSRTILAGI